MEEKMSKARGMTVYHGENGVKIAQTKYGTELALTVNGWQWTKVCVDREMLVLLREQIDAFLVNESNAADGS
jgi:hypothetical protein